MSLARVPTLKAHEIVDEVDAMMYRDPHLSDLLTTWVQHVLLESAWFRYCVSREDAICRVHMWWHAEWKYQWVAWKTNCTLTGVPPAIAAPLSPSSLFATFDAPPPNFFCFFPDVAWSMTNALHDATRTIGWFAITRSQRVVRLLKRHDEAKTVNVIQCLVSAADADDGAPYTENMADLVYIHPFHMADDHNEQRARVWELHKRWFTDAKEMMPFGMKTWTGDRCIEVWPVLCDLITHPHDENTRFDDDTNGAFPTILAPGPPTHLERLRDLMVDHMTDVAESDLVWLMFQSCYAHMDTTTASEPTQNDRPWHVDTVATTTYRAQLHRLVDRPRETLLGATSHGWQMTTLLPFNDKDQIKDWDAWVAFVDQQKQKLAACITWLRFADSQSTKTPHSEVANIAFYELVRPAQRAFWILRHAVAWAYQPGSNVIWVKRDDDRLQLLAITQVKHIFHRIQKQPSKTDALRNFSAFTRFTANMPRTNDDLAMEKKFGRPIPSATALWTQLTAHLHAPFHYAALFAAGQRMVTDQTYPWFEWYIVFCIMQRPYNSPDASGIARETLAGIVGE